MALAKESHSMPQHYLAKEYLYLLQPLAEANGNDGIMDGNNVSELIISIPFIANFVNMFFKFRAFV